jgi:Ran-binding protein 3
LTCRAKLFHFSKGSVAWKERGTGTLKLNTPIDEDYDDDLHEAKEDSSSSTEETEEKDVETSASSEASTSTKITPKKKKPRLIMRADGVMRVLLNAPILKDMTAIIASVNQPNVVSMTVIEDGEPLGIRLRVSSPLTSS